MKNSDKGIAIISYLKRNFEKNVMDLPCYSSSAIQDYFRKRILKICKKIERLSHEDYEIVNIMALLTENPYAPDEYGRTPIHWATLRRHTEIVKILAPLTDNPNAPDRNGKTPIYWAAYHGYIEIVKFLAPLTDNPNAPSKEGLTPTCCATLNGHREIVKILTQLTENLYAPIGLLFIVSFILPSILIFTKKI